MLQVRCHKTLKTNQARKEVGARWCHCKRPVIFLKHNKLLNKKHTKTTGKIIRIALDLVY
jgi:hypothetical protein